MPKVIIYFKADDTKNAYAERGNGGAAVHLSRVPVPSEYIRIGHEEYCVEVVRHCDEAAEGYDATVFARKARFAP